MNKLNDNTVLIIDDEEDILFHAQDVIEKPCGTCIHRIQPIPYSQINSPTRARSYFIGFKF